MWLLFACPAPVEPVSPASEAPEAVEALPDPAAAPAATSEVAPVAVEAVASAVHPTAPAAPVGPTGTWHSPACGARTYTRQITFGSGTYDGMDLVAPCPPNARCVWSGVVSFGGTWALDGSTLTLTETSADGPQGVARPRTLGWSTEPTEPGCRWSAGPPPRTPPTFGR